MSNLDFSFFVLLHFHFSLHLPGIFKNQKQALVSESIVAGTKNSNPAC